MWVETVEEHSVLKALLVEPFLFLRSSVHLGLCLSLQVKSAVVIASVVLNLIVDSV